MKTHSKIPLIGAAGIGLLALSACADEMPSGELSSILEDHTDAREASCDEDLVLSDGGRFPAMPCSTGLTMTNPWQ